MRFKISKNIFKKYIDEKQKEAETISFLLSNMDSATVEELCWLVMQGNDREAHEIIQRRMRVILSEISVSNIPQWFEELACGKRMHIFGFFYMTKEFEAKIAELAIALESKN